MEILHTGRMQTGVDYAGHRSRLARHPGQRRSPAESFGWASCSGARSLGSAAYFVAQQAQLQASQTHAPSRQQRQPSSHAQPAAVQHVAFAPAAFPATVTPLAASSLSVLVALVESQCEQPAFAATEAVALVWQQAQLQSSQTHTPVLQQSQPAAQPVQFSSHREQPPEAQQPPDLLADGVAADKVRPAIDRQDRTRNAINLDMRISFVKESE